MLLSLAQSTVNDSWKNWGAPQPVVGAVSTGGSPVGDGSVGVELDMLLKVRGELLPAFNTTFYVGQNMLVFLLFFLCSVSHTQDTVNPHNNCQPLSYSSYLLCC